MSEYIKKISSEYHQHYEEKQLWRNLKWLGIPMWKLPFDAMIVQNLIYQIQPDYIIETGTGMGGSAAFYASICDLIGHGEVVTIDIENKHELDKLPDYIFSKILFINDNSIDLNLLNELYNNFSEKKNLVILDSWHTYEHVYTELISYSKLVPVGSYIIVEDSHVSGHPVEWKWGKGPYEAIHEFLLTEQGKNFKIDKELEHQEMTFNCDGFLLRVK
jgi:cephalosporin hydroxylase